MRPSLLLASLALVLVGCGSSDADADPPRESSSASASSTPSPAATGTTIPAEWVELEDDAGVTFSLPQDTEPQERGGVGRVYLVEVGEIGLSVSIVEAPTEVPTSYPETVYEQMVSGLEGAGADDVKLSNVSSPEVAQGTAADATLGFTAKTGATNYWRMRTIAAGKLVVQIQVLTFSEKNHAAARKQVDGLFERLAGTVEIT